MSAKYITRRLLWHFYGRNFLLRQNSSSIHNQQSPISNAFCCHHLHHQSNNNSSNFMSTAANAQPNEKLVKSFKTSESDPTNHGRQHDAQFYAIPSKIHEKLFALGGWTPDKQIAVNTFREAAIMIRQPTLEIIDYLRKTDFSRPI